MAKNKPKNLSRRDFLKLSSIAAGGTLLAACASTETAEPVEEVEAVEPDVEPTSEPTSEPEMEPTTIRMVTHWTGEDAHTASMALLYKRFQEANPDIKLDIVEIPDWQQANTKVATE